jgi:alkylation response protein AidB-like acyl-CoA dehydrogenase
MGLSPVSRYASAYAPLLDEFREFVQVELEPLTRQSGLGTGDHIAPELRSFVRRRSAERGFYAGEYPVDVGGRGHPFAAKALMYEYAEECGCPLAPTALCGPAGPSPLLLRATPQQRERFLRPLVDASTTRCLAATEPDGGSDVMGLTTTATRTGDGWRLRGRKCYVSDADQAELVFVLARLVGGDGATQPAVFVVSTSTPGVVLETVRPGLGPDMLCEMFFDDVFAGEDALLGGSAAIGAHQDWMFRALSHGRIVVAATCNGIAARALRLGVGYARTKRSFGAPIGSYQHVQEHIVASRAALESARLITLAAAQDIDDGDEAIEQAALAKLVASEGACRTVDRIFQVHGAAAWIRGHPLEYLYRHVRGTRIVEGTSEVQKLILAAAEGLC